MIDWKEERTKKNYCGYCIDITCVCDGSCFVGNHNISEEEAQKNRIDHLDLEIAKTEERLEELKQEYINKKYEHITNNTD